MKIGGKKMCNFIAIPKDVMEQMKTLYPKNMSGEYFDEFKSMAVDYVIKNKNGLLRTNQLPAEGFEKNSYRGVIDIPRDDLIVDTFDYSNGLYYKSGRRYSKG